MEGRGGFSCFLFKTFDGDMHDFTMHKKQKQYDLMVSGDRGGLGAWMVYLTFCFFYFFYFFT